MDEATWSSLVMCYITCWCLSSCVMLAVAKCVVYLCWCAYFVICYRC
jgi:hypothetical protein